LTLGGLIDKQVNADEKKGADATNAIVNSRLGSYTWVEDNNEYYGGYWKWQTSGCTPWTEKTAPQSPQYNSIDGTYTYKGVAYPDYKSAAKPYNYDWRNYDDFRGYNYVSSKSTRWVFNYANTSAPLAPVKLPLQFQ